MVSSAGESFADQDEERKAFTHHLSACREVNALACVRGTLLRLARLASAPIDTARATGSIRAEIYGKGQSARRLKWVQAWRRIALG